MKIILKTFIIIVFFSVSHAEEKKFDQKTCEEIYVGISYFLKTADKYWKETKNEKKLLCTQIQPLTTQRFIIPFVNNNSNNGSVSIF